MAETNCAKERRERVPVGLREKGYEAPVYFRASHADLYQHSPENRECAKRVSWICCRDISHSSYTDISVMAVMDGAGEHLARCRGKGRARRRVSIGEQSRDGGESLMGFWLYKPKGTRKDIGNVAGSPEYTRLPSARRRPSATQASAAG
jgi:hypothetical protein